ncbi:MAG: hypothetical protein ABIG89_03480 [Candidatus Woesearchaeota archaeon]
MKYLKLFYLLLLLLVVVFVQANEFPQIPMSVLGTVYVNDNPAELGTLIEAKIDDEVRGSLKLANEDGRFAFPIEGEFEDDSKLITFYVRGEKLDQTETWKSGKIIEDFNLNIQMNLFEKLTIDKEGKEHYDYLILIIVIFLIFLLILFLLLRKLIKS